MAATLAVVFFVADSKLSANHLGTALELYQSSGDAQGHEVKANF